MRTSRSFIVLLTPVLLMAVAGWNSPGVEPIVRPSASTAGCLTPDSVAFDLRDGLISLMGRSDALSDTILKGQGVVRVLTSQISIVSDTTACRRAAEAYSGAIAATDSNRMVHTVKAGIRYVVIDPAYQAGSYMVGITFDSSFSQPLSKFAF